jgi:hypothetical protein
VKNDKGWSEFSPITTFTAADVPSRLPVPKFVGATASGVTVTLNSALTEDGGMPILGYILETNDGTSGSAFTAVPGYSASLTYPDSYTITVATDGLVAGRIYSIRWYAYNAIGNGLASEKVLAAVVDDFMAPDGLEKDQVNSSKTRISM